MKGREVRGESWVSRAVGAQEAESGEIAPEGFSVAACRLRFIDAELRVAGSGWI